VTASEEFGIAAVEALASGRPVIALGSGGVLETVREGETGAFYGVSEAEALAAVVADFDPLAVDPAVCVEASRRFGTERFQASLRQIVAEAVAAAERSGERDPLPSRTGLSYGLLQRRAARRGVRL
jgi:glycosyltransferase involved in cell wall biosynthesis